MDIPTSPEPEDAAARALAKLILAGIRRHPDVSRSAALYTVCRELLRGPLDEAAVPGAGHFLGGYCLRTPTDPTLLEIARIGARLVELTYTTPDPQRAKSEARDLIEPLCPR